MSDHDLTITTNRAPWLYSSEVQDVLARICTPIKDAKPGDVLAVIAPHRYDPRTMQSLQISSFVTLAAGENRATTITHYRDLPDAIKPRIADAIMQIQSDQENRSAFRGVMEQMLEDGDWHVFTEVIMMPSVACVVVSDYIDNLANGGRYSDEDRDQWHIDVSLQAIVAEPKSHHDALAVMQHLDNACDIIFDRCPIVDGDGETITLNKPTLEDLV